MMSQFGLSVASLLVFIQAVGYVGRGVFSLADFALILLFPGMLGFVPL